MILREEIYNILSDADLCFVNELTDEIMDKIKEAKKDCVIELKEKSHLEQIKKLMNKTKYGIMEHKFKNDTELTIINEENNIISYWYFDGKGESKDYSTESLY